MEGIKPYINLKVIGRVDKFVVDHVLKILREFYGRLEENAKPEMVDVQVFEKRSIMLGFLTSASRGLEVTYPFDESYIAMHEAWTGIPKIHVCTEDLERLPRSVFNAALRHEAAHSALHGSPEYYIVSIPANLATEFRRKGFTEEEIKHLAYLEASALKDIEASKLLKNLGYVEDQVAFILNSLEMEKSDIVAWRIASTNPKANLIYLAHMLKAFASSMPFSQAPQHGERLVTKRKEACSHLDQKACNALEALGKTLEKAEGSFHRKMVYLLKETLKLIFSS